MLIPQPSLKRFQVNQGWDLVALEQNPPKLLLFYLFIRSSYQGSRPTGLQKEMESVVIASTEKTLLKQFETGALSTYHAIKLFFKCPHLMSGREMHLQDQVHQFLENTSIDEKSKRQREKVELILRFCSVISS